MFKFLRTRFSEKLLSVLLLMLKLYFEIKIGIFSSIILCQLERKPDVSFQLKIKSI